MKDESLTINVNVLLPPPSITHLKLKTTGAPTSACNFDLNSVGCVFVYRRASNGTWLYQHMLGAYDSIYEKNPLLPRVPLLADPAVRTQFILTNANAFFGDAYGLSLKLRGDFLIVGAPEDANFTLPETIFTNTTPAGSFHIFRRNNNADVSRNTSWIRESKVRSEVPRVCYLLILSCSLVRTIRPPVQSVMNALRACTSQPAGLLVQGGSR